ncbi:hypothetical protein GCM10023321_06590 [Pseudonocardia eucalypti]|uniref:Uncharacterized protein n=1 Tax=Pseudonocardia eucalypti TaxID=648755 RepID=A0ABP9PHT5_9PSEU
MSGVPPEHAEGNRPDQPEPGRHGGHPGPHGNPVRTRADARVPAGRTGTPTRQTGIHNLED